MCIKIQSWLRGKVVCVCRAGLEEELDMLRVQAAKDRATVKELHLCLAKEHRGKHFHAFHFSLKLIFFTNKHSFSPSSKLIYLILEYILAIFHLPRDLFCSFVFLNVCNRSIIITVRFTACCFKQRACSCLTHYTFKPSFYFWAKSISEQN